MCNIECFFGSFIHIRFNGPINFSKYLIIPNISSVYIIRYMFLDRYIVLVNSWYSLSEFYPELTWFFENFLPVSSIVPIFCFAIHP